MITKRINKKYLALSFLAGFVAIFFLAFYIWDQTESVSIGYETKDLEEEIERLKVTIEQLESQKADLLSLDRVEQIARQELGMILPSETQIIFEQNKTDLRHPQP